MEGGSKNSSSVVGPPQRTAAASNVGAADIERVKKSLVEAESRLVAMEQRQQSVGVYNKDTKASLDRQQKLLSDRVAYIRKWLAAVEKD